MKAVDMHCDTIGEIWKAGKEGTEISLRENNLHVDLNKLLRGGYLLQNFAMFVYLQEGSDPLETVLEMIDVYRSQMEMNSDLIAPVSSWKDIQQNIENGKLSAMLTLEEGAVTKGNPAVLRTLYELGARMMTLTWNFENMLAYPHNAGTEEFKTGSDRLGLKEAGITIVEEMCRLGMIVDVSHLSDDGFWDVARICRGPFVASHSNAREVCAHSRNLTDNMIRTIADHGGVIGLNFFGGFLSNDGKSTIESMIRHIRHIYNVGGIDVIGLGTDYDGISGELEIPDSGHLQKLAIALAQCGFLEREIEAIFSCNVLRVYKEVLG